MALEPLKNNHFYHFYNRGNNKENIFRSPENYIYFLELMKIHLSKVVDFYSFCLLPNHFHFVFQVKDQQQIEEKYWLNLHQPFSNFFNAYTKAYNKKYNRTGSLFQKHPKRKRIEDEEYLRNLILYVNTNSSHHGIEDYKLYNFSSYKALISNKPTLLKREETIELFDNLDNFKRSHELKKINLELIKGVILE